MHAPSAVLANEAATAALVLGHDAVGWLEEQGRAARLVDREGRVRSTTGWPEQEQGVAA